jgi:hypothetical protein
MPVDSRHVVGGIVPRCHICRDDGFVNLRQKQGDWYCARCHVPVKPNPPIDPLITGDISVFYVILNSQLQPQSPDQTGFIKSLNPESPAPHNKLFFEEGKKDLAERFAEWLAGKYSGQKFYLAHITDYVQTAEPPIQWKNKSNGGGAPT